jgi:hypothetical protein
MESGTLITSPSSKCSACFAELADVETTRVSRGAPKIEHVDPMPDAAGTVAVSYRDGKYQGNIVTERAKRNAMLAAGVKLYTVHADVCAKRGGSHKRS